MTSRTPYWSKCFESIANLLKRDQKWAKQEKQSAKKNSSMALITLDSEHNAVVLRCRKSIS